MKKFEKSRYVYPMIEMSLLGARAMDLDQRLREFVPEPDRIRLNALAKRILQQRQDLQTRYELP